MSSCRPSACKSWLVLAAAASIAGCADLRLEDCPDRILGSDTPRLRTSHYRVELANPGKAAERFLVYALMSAHAYRDGERCHTSDAENPVPEARADELVAMIRDTSPSGDWRLVSGFGPRDDCEDERGLMMYVWTRSEGGRDEVVIAFRGTSGWRDWLYGNLWWATRAYEDNQLTRARNAAGAVIAHFRSRAQRTGAAAPVFFATGHSLGGGLAQHVLYAYPDDIRQAFAFHPSSVTGYSAIEDKPTRIKGCSCANVAPEARMMRIYESYEILANLRIFHKIFFPPERHVQEVRFPFHGGWNMLAGHNMYDFARAIRGPALEPRADMGAQPWYSARGEGCTAKLVEAQQSSCAYQVKESDRRYCPQ